MSKQKFKRCPIGFSKSRTCPMNGIVIGAAQTQHNELVSCWVQQFKEIVRSASGDLMTSIKTHLAY